MSIFQKIAALANVVSDGRKAISDGELLVADLVQVESDPAVRAALDANPATAASLSRISAEIRSLEEDITKVKADLRF